MIVPLYNFLVPLNSGHSISKKSIIILGKKLQKRGNLNKDIKHLACELLECAISLVCMKQEEYPLGASDGLSS